MAVSVLETHAFEQVCEDVAKAMGIDERKVRSH